MSKLAKEALLDEIVAAIDVNKNGLIDMKLGGNLTSYDKSGLQNTCHLVAILMSLDFNGFYIYVLSSSSYFVVSFRSCVSQIEFLQPQVGPVPLQLRKEFVHALKLPQDVADPQAPPPQAAPEPSEDVTPPEPEEVEDTTMAGLTKRLSQASHASRAQSSPQALPEAEGPPRSPPRSPRVSRESAVPALQDLPAAPEAETAEGPSSPPAESPESPESPSDATKGDSTRKSSTTPRKSQAKGSSNASGLLSRASRAMGSLAGSSSTSTTRSFAALD